MRLEGAGMKERPCGAVNGVVVSVVEMTNSEILAAIENAKKSGKGVWLKHPHDSNWRVCAVCGTGTEIVRHEGGITTKYGYRYCPWCGAMLAKEED